MNPGNSQARIDKHPCNFYGKTFNEIFGRCVEFLDVSPQFISAPRGQKVKESIATTLVLEDPRARLLTYKSRDANYGFAVGEFLWYWAGRQDLKTMLYYNKRMKDFSDNGTTLNSAYGYRLKTETLSGLKRAPGDVNYKIWSSQWDTCKQTLLKDNDSRRAILLVNRPYDQFEAELYGSKDVPCTLSLQFFIREGRLDMHAHMRSNDAFWGLTYDLFSFTLFQECMLLELQDLGLKDLKLGAYYHTAGSMHIYERHFDMAHAVSREWELLHDEVHHEAEVMEPIDLPGLARLVEQEELLRTGKVEQLDELQFSGGVRWMAAQLNAHRRKRDEERGREVRPGDGGGAQVV